MGSKHACHKTLPLVYGTLSVFQGRKQTCPLLLRVVQSHLLLLLLYKHLIKDNLDQRQSVLLLTRHAEMQETHSLPIWQWLFSVPKCIEP